MFKFCCTSIRNQIFFLIVLMTCLPLGIIISDTIRQYQHEINEAAEIVSSVAQQINNDQVILLTEAEQLVSTLSALHSIQDHDSKAVNSLLTNLIKTNPNYVNISITDRSGLVWASAIPSKIGSSHAERYYFKKTVSSNQISASEYADEKEWQVPLITIAFPITDRSGTFSDVCEIFFSLERYQNLYVGEHKSPTSLIVLTDHNGTIIFSSNHPQAVGKQDRTDLFSKMSQGADTGSFEAVGNFGVRRIFAYKRLNLNGSPSPYMYIRTGLSKEHIQKSVFNSLAVNIGALLVAMILVVMLAVLISKKGILDKVAALRDSTHRITQGDLTIKCSDSMSANELDQLGCSLTEMSQQLRETDAALNQSIQNYRELVDNASSIILKWDTEGRILFYNEYAEKFFGFSSTEILGRNLIGTIVPETESSGQDLAEMIRNIALNPEEYLNNENENIRKDGERVWISWNNRVLTDADGNRVGILSVGQDITVRKWMEQELKRSEERFRSFVENANDVVFALTPEGVFSYVSPQWKNAFGYELSETVGQPFPRFVHPDDVQGCFDFLQKVMVTGQKQSGVEYRVRCKDGRYLNYKANGALIQDPVNNSVTFIGIGRDITERKIAEESLRQSEEKFSAAFRASPDSITLTRLSDGAYLDVNEGFTNLSGYTPEEAIGRSSIDLGLWNDPNDRTTLGKRLEADGLVDNMVAKFCRKDGLLLTGQMSVRIVEIDGHLCLLGITRDVTEHEYLQQELIKSQKLESLAVLAGGIAHNFNNVLTGVIGYISYAKKHLEDSEKVLPILESAEKASYRAAGLARQLLTFSKGGTPVKKPVPVHNLLEESVSLFLTGTNIKGEIDCCTQQIVHVDSLQISQAFNNIILNAVHAMQDGGTLKVQAKPVRLPAGNRYSLQPGYYVKIDFNDSGCGIQNENLLKIYDPYFTTKDSGTGLGLTTTFSIIKRHNGHMDITSTVGEGTTVSILLPAVADVSEGGTGVATHHENSISNISILVMDDEEIIRDLVDNLLSEQGYEVTTCVNSEAAVDLYKASIAAKKVFSVVILDLLIPGGMGGIETAKRILEIDATAALIVSSGYADDPALAEYEKYGFSGAISKPYNAEQLLQTVRAAAMHLSG